MRLSPLSRNLVRGSIAGGLVTGLLLLSGCARPVGSVSGKVSYNGKLLKGGNVTFVSQDGQPSSSSTISEDGTYKVLKLTGGDYKVLVDTANLKGGPAANTGPGPAGGGSGGPPGFKGGKAPSTPALPKNSAPPAGANIPEGYKASNPAEQAQIKYAKLYVEIPPKYADVGKTDLKYTMNGGDQTFDIDLK